MNGTCGAVLCGHCGCRFCHILIYHFSLAHSVLVFPSILALSLDSFVCCSGLFLVVYPLKFHPVMRDLSYIGTILVYFIQFSFCSSYPLVATVKTYHLNCSFFFLYFSLKVDYRFNHTHL